MERWNGGTVERWNGGTVEWWNGGMVERRNGGMVERRNILGHRMMEYPKTRNAFWYDTKVPKSGVAIK